MATILVIEDEKLLREDIGEVLTLEEFDVVEAPNGRVGIQTAIEQQPDLILCDISMPEADGYEVLDTLRNHTDTTEIPFIFLTARVDTEFVRKAEGMGVDEYMTKPFSNSNLMNTIRAFLRQRELFSSFYADSLESLKQQMELLVAHELRAYSVLPSAVAGLIARQLDAADAGRLLALVNSGGHHLRYLTNQLANQVRVELGLVSHEKILHKGMVVGLGPLLMSAVVQAKQLANRLHEDAVRVQETEEQHFVQCDSRALRQALADAITQALAASPPGRAVTISQHVVNQHVSIIITHEDSGRPEPLVPELLYGSANVLRLSSQIIQLHGGSLNTSGNGRVEINLPLVTLNLCYG
jgi:two-component system sensor histidine kinase/response regulator